MEIIIVEDSQNFSKELEKNVKDFFVSNSIEHTITVISNDYHSNIARIRPSIAFLDIDLVIDNGIDVALSIVEENPKCLIIFVSSRQDLVFQSFVVQPFYFVRKQQYKEDLKVLFVLLKKELTSKMIPAFTSRKLKKKIPLDSIIYVESKSHVLLLHTKDEILSENHTLQEFNDYTSKFGFVKVHKSYVVNMSEIETVDTKNINLTGGIRIPIGRKYKDIFINEYERYLLL